MLIGMGISKANAEKIASTTPDDGGTIEQPEIDTILAGWKTDQIALMENEPTLIEKIQKSERAKQLDQFERKIKQTFGLTSEEIKDKKFDEIIAIAKQKATVNGDKTLDQLQQEIVTLTTENKRLTEEEIPKIRGEVDSHKRKIDLKTIISKKVPTGDDKLRIPYETALKLVESDLYELYDVDLDEKGEPVLKVKGSDLKPKSADGTKFLTVDDVIGERLVSHKALKESNADDGKKRDAAGNIIVEKPAGEEGAGKGGNKLFLSAAEQHLSTLKAEDAAKGK